MDARAIGHVLEDRLRERVRLLEHHPDPGAQRHHVDGAVIDLLAVELDLAADTAAVSMVSFIRLMTAQEGRLAAARRARCIETTWWSPPGQADILDRVRHRRTRPPQ
jgi:hypothetical protein